MPALFQAAHRCTPAINRYNECLAHYTWSEARLIVAIIFNCPCGKDFNAKDDYAGKRDDARSVTASPGSRIKTLWSGRHGHLNHASTVCAIRDAARAANPSRGRCEPENGRGYANRIRFREPSRIARTDPILRWRRPFVAFSCSSVRGMVERPGKQATPQSPDSPTKLKAMSPPPQRNHPPRLLRLDDILHSWHVC